MTAQLSRERLEQISDSSSTLITADEAISMARMLLEGMESEPYGYVHQVVYEDNGSCGLSNDHEAHRDSNTHIPIFRHPSPPAPVVDDYFADLVTQARARANKAMRKFPQPNYVLNKVAEESGEVIKAVIHYTEGREEWRNVEGEIIDNLAMLIRLVQEGDQVIGFTPPTDCRAAMLKAGTVTADTVPDGWKLVPVEPTAEMISSGITAHYERSQIQIHDRPAPGPMECGYVAMLAASPAAPEREV